MTRRPPTDPRLWAALALALFASPAAAADVNEAIEKAMKDATAHASPSVVKIETSGGVEVIVPPPPRPGRPPSAPIRRGVGPTTGLIVAADGYVITSSFNFANKPTDIFVTVPGRARFVAKVVAHDQSRMLTLLKIDAKDLPVPTPVPKKEVQVGQWALALGRTVDPNADHPPSLAAGIVSATGRIWGKMIQTDAKVSPINYGGPLVAIDGRVLGVLVPASPLGEGETSGVELYDSGIGYAVPLEDILAVVPRLKEGKDLRRGLLGITPQGSDQYGTQPVIGAVQPDSAAARAGIQVGDKVVEIDGKPIPNYSTLQHVLGPKYEGEKVQVKVMRGDKPVEFPSITLLGSLTAYVNPFLGILPMRDDPEAGVLVRYVYPRSPAEAAGLKIGDRITKVGPKPDPMAKKGPPTMNAVKNAAALAGILARLSPGTEIQLEVTRKDGGKVETVGAKLGTVPDALPERLPLPSSLGGAAPEKPKEEKKDEKKPPTAAESANPLLVNALQEPKKEEPKKEEPKKEEKVETGLLKRTNEALGREYWVYVPDSYNPKVSHGLIVWFHAAGQGGKDAEVMARTFREFCEDRHFIMMGPKSQAAEGWVPSEAEQLMQDVKAVIKQYTIDKPRVIAHGMGVGGQMSCYLGFTARDTFRGVAAVGSVLGTAPKENVATLPLSFFLAWGDKDPLAKDIAAGKAALDEKRFPVIAREMKEAGKEYLDVRTFEELLVWMDSLDRI
jgi:S1-C subfamily serine protease/predicted esterase